MVAHTTGAPNAADETKVAEESTMTTMPDKAFVVAMLTGLTGASALMYSVGHDPAMRPAIKAKPAPAPAVVTNAVFTVASGFNERFGNAPPAVRFPIEDPGPVVVKTERIVVEQSEEEVRRVPDPGAASTVPGADVRAPQPAPSRGRLVLRSKPTGLDICERHRMHRVYYGRTWRCRK
jgi:hypothetical protein